MPQQKKDNFQQKPFEGDSMNFFRKKTGKFGEHRLNPFADILLVPSDVRFVPSPGIFLSRRGKHDAVGLTQTVLDLTVGVCAVGIHFASFRKIKGKFVKSIRIMRSAGKEHKFDRNPAGGRQDVKSDSVEIPLFGGYVSPVFFGLDNFTPFYADIVTDRNRFMALSTSSTIQ